MIFLTLKPKRYTTKHLQNPNMSNQNLESNKLELYAAYQAEVAQRSKLQVAMRQLEQECTGIRHALNAKTMELASADGSLHGLQGYCRDLQMRTSTAEAKNAELVVENDELKARVEELTKLLMALQQ